MSPLSTLPLPVSSAGSTARAELTSPGLVHDVDVIDESPISCVSDTLSSTVEDKTSSLKDTSATCSIDEVDIENVTQRLDSDEKALARYVVPVLDKGVKTALAKPTSPWIRFRIWYNPYRMVSLFCCSCITTSILIYRQLFTFVFALNMVGIVVACTHHFPYAEHHGAALALGNIMSAVACRNEFFLRYLFWVVVKVFQKVRSALFVWDQ